MVFFIIVFGTKGISRTQGTGTFYCPDCGEQPYVHKRVRRFFTLYWIPLIPLNLLGEYVECGMCTGTFKPDVLELDPRADNAAFEAEFHRAVRRIMALIALADGVVHPDEVDTICQVYSRLTDRSLSPEECQREIEEARADGRGPEAYLGELRGTLNDSGKEMVVRAAMFVAAADGEFQDEERELVIDIGAALDMRPSEVMAVVGEVFGGRE